MQKVLLVDSNYDYQNLISAILKRNKINIQCAVNAEKALKYLHKYVFNVMITDFDANNIDGIALAKDAIGLTPNIKVIMITGTMSPGLPAMAKQAGISAVLSKPFNADALLCLLDKMPSSNALTPA